MKISLVTLQLLAILFSLAYSQNDAPPDSNSETDSVLGSCETVCSQHKGNCTVSLTALAATPCFDTNTMMNRTCNCDISYDDLQRQRGTATVRDCVFPDDLNDRFNVVIRANLVNVHAKALVAGNEFRHEGNIEQSTICSWMCGTVDFTSGSCFMSGRVIDNTIREIRANPLMSLTLNGSRFSRNNIPSEIFSYGLLNISTRVRFRNNVIGNISAFGGMNIDTEFRNNQMNQIELRGDLTISGIARKNSVASRVFFPLNNVNCMADNTTGTISPITIEDQSVPAPCSLFEHA